MAHRTPSRGQQRNKIRAAIREAVAAEMREHPLARAVVLKVRVEFDSPQPRETWAMKIHRSYARTIEAHQ